MTSFAKGEALTGQILSHEEKNPRRVLVRLENGQELKAVLTKDVARHDVHLHGSIAGSRVTVVWREPPKMPRVVKVVELALPADSPTDTNSSS